MPSPASPPDVSEATVETPLGDVWLRVEAGALREMIFIDQHRHQPQADLDAAAKLNPASTITSANGNTAPASTITSANGNASSAAHEPAAIPASLEEIALAVERYFAGDVDALDEIPIQTDGTRFQRAVWDAIREIPAGRTMSYLEIARAIGRPAAARAVGQATGRNPVSIVVPCHRVISSDGSLGGYGGGLHRKQWFLDHERRHASAGAPRCQPGKR